MNHKDTPGKKPGMPSPKDILDFVTSRQGRASKAEIAKHFHIKGNDRIGLKGILKDLLNRGTLQQGSFRNYILPGQKEKDTVVLRKKDQPRDDEGKEFFVGLFQTLKTGGGLITPVSRKDKSPVMIAEGRTQSAAEGDLVRAVYSVRGWQIEEILSHSGDAGMISLMAIKTLEIPDIFPQEVLDECEGLEVPPLGDRTDYRKIPLVTIDGEDARDFDDAVFAEPDTDPNNPDGWKLLVAIADVSHYVKPGSALDEEAYKRGNSVYFPDRVVPMLPEALSNDMCSLRPHVERACMVAEMRIDKFGELKSQRVKRGLMKSAARLTYTQVQMALDGQPDDMTSPLLDNVIRPLYAAYKTLEKARAQRGAVELDLPERKVILKDGEVQDISMRMRFESHKLIEEFMILANVATATVLEKEDQQLLYRIHDKPDNSRWAATKEFLQELGLRPKSGLSPSPKDMKALLAEVVGRDEAPLVNDIVLRSMAQASYSPANVGHFGLALERYAHFTSPIRRYADLIVHRALIRALHLGNDGLTDYEVGRLAIIGEHISNRERVAQGAERETIDRYIATYLEDQVGATFGARISGVTSFGIFVTIEPTGADGLVPIRTLPNDYYIHDEKRHSLVGRRTGMTFRLAMPLTVRLLEVELATGRLLMELVPGTIAIPDVPPSSRRSDRRDRDKRNRFDPPNRNPNRNRRGTDPKTGRPKEPEDYR